jgi:hypothetical protein
VSLVDEFYLELTEVAKFPSERAWALVGRCVAAIFEVMKPYRAKVAMLQDPSALATKASILWAVMQCHRIMQRFIVVKFRGHPAFVKEMSLFMITERVDPSEIKALQEKVKSAQAAATMASGEVEKLEDQMRGMKRSFDNLKNDFATLKNKK